MTKSRETGMSIRKLVQVMIAEVVVATLMTSLIVVAYAWVIPRYFDDARTPIIFVVGVAIGAVLSAVIAKKFVNKSGLGAWLAVAVGAIAVSVLIVLTTLGVLTNMLGS